MLLIREEHVRRLLPMEAAIHLMKEAFLALDAGDAQNQPRRRLVLPTGAVLHSLAGAHGRYFGTKVYTTHPRHEASFLFLLWDAATARPLALFEANYLGQIRTGAATGLATSVLATPEADSLGMIGSGFQARTQLEAVLSVRKIRHASVWSRSADKRDAFARECTADFGLKVEPASSAEDAVKDAAVVVTATYSKNPVVENEWIGAGTHVNAIGSNRSDRRELPEALVRRAALIAVDSIEQARIESGDLLCALDQQEWSQAPIVELSEVVAGKRSRGGAGDVTIFKSNGLGIEDVIAAGYVYEKAMEKGVGDRLDLLHS